jgi:hypothetical protein
MGTRFAGTNGALVGVGAMGLAVRELISTSVAVAVGGDVALGEAGSGLSFKGIVAVVFCTL